MAYDTRRLWGGFCDGKLDIREMDTGWGGFGSGDGMRRMPAIFTSRKAARQEYEDVRPIGVTHSNGHQGGDA
jgi:hypothetical protein